MRTGVQNMITRQNNGIERFLSAVQEQFGKTREEAEAVYRTFVRHKLVKIDAVTGQWQLKTGNAWEQEVIDRAVTWTRGPKD